jgi:hypothetical protein
MAANRLSKSVRASYKEYWTMSARLHSLTAISLAALYGLVGLTGESLHYLANDYLANGFTSSASSTASSSEAGVYYHTHGPDHHGHFHHHHGEVETASSAAVPGDDRSGNTKTGQQFHGEHACPLLTVVSTLKLGSGGCVVATVDRSAQTAYLSESPVCLAFEAARSSLARGPPRLV